MEDAILDDRDLEERVLWRLARCRDYLKGDLTPYFDTGIDTVEDAACRLARIAISLARSIPLGAQAYVAIETAEVLRKHGLKGVYGLLLRKEFLAAADLLCRVLGINKTNWPLSVHELSAAIFYALAQHRALRGLRPEGEELIHSLKPSSGDDPSVPPQKEEEEEEEEEEGRWTSTRNYGDSSKKSNPHLPVLIEDPTVDDAGNDLEMGNAIISEGCSRKFLAGEISESVLDETDVYDPASEKVVDVLAMSAAPNRINSASSERGKDNVAHSRKYGEVDDKNFTSLDDATHGHDATTRSRLPFEPVCEHVPDTLISSLLFFAPLALDFIYAENEVDMQLLAAQQGWRLIYASLDQNHHHVAHAGNYNDLEGNDHFSDRPACALFAHDERKIACLSIRGTATIQDVVTDIRATPVPFPQQDEEEDEDQNGERNTRCLDEKEWTPSVDVTTPSPDSISINEDGFVRVYSYGTPSCVDSKLADHPRILELCTSVVLHDDVVPRLTPTSVRGLLKHLLYIRETWVKTHLSDDLNAITERAYHVWPNRLRGSFTLLKKKGVASAKRLKKTCEKRIQGKTTKSSGLTPEHGHKECADEQCSGTCYGYHVRNKSTTCTYEDQSDEGTNISSDDGVDIDGDLFYDPTDPLNESDDESSVCDQPLMSSNRGCDNDWVPFDEPPIEFDTNATSLDTTIHNGAYSQIHREDQSNIDSDTQPQILEELPLPRMFIPGGYKAAFVPRRFRSLRRISMAGNMLSDHMTKAYYEGLLEVKAVRAAKQDLPPWVGFADDCTCACCASLFTWASTSNTEAQAARDKHNCRACGGLVCDPCSKKRIPIPAIGITMPVRVCDRCYNGWGTLYGDLEVSDNVPSGRADKSMDTQSSMDRSGGKMRSSGSRRSVVVDELVSRIPSISC
ncbi:hypothetical protein ACHAXA_006545 [Cyclostephanos tholiformis]|uniref:FYVE-type domain-containing protein n=1 Tax=Cyclostephanos tholiformis TaxID=382380 RepID=A0ABD3RDC1_9STRA